MTAPRVLTQRSGLVLCAACLVAAVLVLTPLPPSARLVTVLPVALVAPGLCVARRIKIREPLVELALAFPVSGAVWLVVAEAQLYIHAWHPRLALAMVFLVSAASVLPELRPRMTGIGGGGGKRWLE